MSGAFRRSSDIVYLGWQIFLRDFRVRHRRATLGYAWTLAPLVTISGTAIAVANQFGLDGTEAGMPYPLFVVLGLVVWGVFSDGVTMPQQMCRRSRTFLRRTPVPYAALLVASTGYLLLNLLIKATVVMALMIYFTVPPSAGVLVTLASLVALGLCGLAVGAVLAPISLVYLDIRYGLPFVLIIALLMTPVFYPTPSVGPIHDINAANPLTYLVAAARDSLVLGTSVHAVTALMIVPCITLLFVGAIVYYGRSMPRGIANI